MNDREILEDMAADINSWGNFYIIADEESVSLAREFHSMLEMQNISSFVIVEGMEDGFKEDLDEDDSVLLISRSGRDDFVRTMVKVALKKRVRTYAVCSDFRSPLAMLCEEVLVIKTDDFKEHTLRIIDYISKVLSNENEDDDYEVTLSGCLEIEDQSSNPPEGSFLSPMQGMIVKINVNVCDEVKEGDVLCVMEAMKMENEVCSDRDGIVEEILVECGDEIRVDDALMVIK